MHARHNTGCLRVTPAFHAHAHAHAHARVCACAQAQAEALRQRTQTCACARWRALACVGVRWRVSRQRCARRKRMHGFVRTGTGSTCTYLETNGDIRVDSGGVGAIHDSIVHRNRDRRREQAHGGGARTEEQPPTQSTRTGANPASRPNRLCIRGRVVKATDLKSVGVSPRRFEPCRMRKFFSGCFCFFYSL